MSVAEKLAKIQALIDRADSPGERAAALAALERVKRASHSRPRSFLFHLNDEWSKRLFVAIARKYGLRPFRYKRQRYTTVNVWVSSELLNDVVWPEFQTWSRMLQELQVELTEGLIQKISHGEEPEEEVREEAPQLAGHCSV